MAERPGVGVAAIIVRNGKVLLGRRRRGHGAGCWQFPGGHLEFGESIEACALREVLEETGLSISNLRLGPYTNDIFADDGRHYVTLFVLSECPDGEPIAMEPDKSGDWQWFPWENLPEPLFQPIRNLLVTNFSIRDKLASRDGHLK